MSPIRRSFIAGWSHEGPLDPNVFHKEIRISCFAIAVTLVAILAYTVEGGSGLVDSVQKSEWAKTIECLIGKGLMGYFLFSGLVYQLMRLGYLRRFQTRCRTPASDPEWDYYGDAPSLAILVPSYKEESRVVRQTLLSAALQVGVGGALVFVAGILIGSS